MYNIKSEPRNIYNFWHGNSASGTSISKCNRENVK